jgi:hypothetical protein
MPRHTRYALAIQAVLIAGFLFSPAALDAQELKWVRQFGTTRPDRALAVAKGPTGVYVTGNTFGVFPGQNSAGASDVDAFVSRYDELGNALWTRQFGSTTVAEDHGTGVATDQTGVYVVGWTYGALASQTSTGNSDAFIRKYDSNGNVLWTRQFGTIAVDEALGVAADGTGVYVVGATEGDLITSGQPQLGRDAFIRRYDANGTVVWTRQFGTGNNETAFAVTTDATGIYVAGTTDGALAEPQGNLDGFLRKYDTGGNVVWTRQLGTVDVDSVFAVSAGALAVYVAGSTTGTFPGYTHGAGLYDGFVMKFNVSGTQQWVRQIGSASDVSVFGLAVSASSVITVGSAGDTLTAKPYTGSAFIRSYDLDGGLQETTQFGNGANDVANGIATDATGAYVAGDKSGDALDQIPVGDLDAFVLTFTPPATTSLPFSISNFAGISTSTDGSGGLSTGHARIETTSGTTPSGVAIFGYRPAGILVTEAGVPDSPLITSGRIYGEVSATATVNTGLAIANPNNQTATVSFTLTDSAGATVKTGSTTIVPNGQIAGFLNQAPYSSGNGFRGTLSFTSNVAVGVVALRSLFNERSDFLITTLPVIDLSRGASSGTQVIPHFAVGDGWETQIILVNPTDTAQTGTVQFFGPGSGSTPGSAVTVNIDGTAASSAPYTVAARSSLKLVARAATSGLSYGSVRVVPASAGAAPTPLVIFGYKPGPFTLSEAGVPVTTGTAFRMYVEASAAPAILSGIAIANTTNVAGTVTLEALNMGGVSVATSSPRTLPASGQLVGFLNEFFPNIAQPFQGILRISTSGTAVSVVALRQRNNERGDYLITTTPPTLETGTASAAARSFPHFVNGDGYTTQFVLFSGTAGQTATGTMRFYTQGGASLPVKLR